MKLTLVSIQTNVLFYLPFIFSVFNIYLASANTLSPSPSISPEVRKVIKESELQKTEYRLKTIVIDPGHGGHDPGCSGSSSREKHLALAIALELSEKIRASYPNIKVIMTRDEDVFIPLYERAAIANRNNADLFISIHCNAMPKGHNYVHGSETYVMGLHTAKHNLDVAKRENASILLEADYEKNYDYDPNSTEGHIMLSMFQNVFLEQSIQFANSVEQMIHQHTQRKSRGVKQAGFVVLKETTMPSVLIEVGFLSNASDEKYLKSEGGQESMAESIYLAFSSYKKKIESGQGAAPLQSIAKALPSTPEKQAKPVLTNVEKAVVASTTPPPAKMDKSGFEDPGFYAGSEIKSAPTKNMAPPPGTMNPKKESKIITLQGSRVEKSEYSSKTLPSTIVPEKKPEVKSHKIQFYVQLAASKKPLDTGNGRWQNLEDYLVQVVQEGDLYKYQIRNFVGFQQAARARIQIQQKGFPDAFIVPYQDGGRISMDTAKRALGIE